MRRKTDRKPGPQPLTLTQLARVGGGDNPGMGPYDPPPPSNSGAPAGGPCRNIWGEDMGRCINDLLWA